MDTGGLIVAIVNGVFLLLVAFVSQHYGRSIHKQAKENSTRLARVEFQTNGELDRKIRAAVVAVFKEHKAEVTEAVMAESVRHLLNAIIEERA